MFRFNRFAKTMSSTASLFTRPITVPRLVAMQFSSEKPDHQGDGYEDEYRSSIFKSYVESSDDDAPYQPVINLLPHPPATPTAVAELVTARNLEEAHGCSNLLDKLKQKGCVSEYEQTHNKLEKPKDTDSTQAHAEFQTSIKSVLYDIYANSPLCTKSDKKEIKKVFNKQHWDTRLTQCLAMVDKISGLENQKYEEYLGILDKMSKLQLELDQFDKSLGELLQIKAEAGKVCENPRLYEYHSKLFNETRDNQEFWNKHRYNQHITNRLERLYAEYDSQTAHAKPEYESNGYHVIADWLKE
jgi:hypothetical protein